MKRLILSLAILLAAAPVWAKEYKYNQRNAEDIMRVCATCHGEFGQGGGGGVYPRVAGLPDVYIAQELRRFKSKVRENIPMLPYATERDLPEADLRDISTYIAGIKLENRMPAIEGHMDGYERLMIAKKILQIPKHPGGDEERGKEIYMDDCATCHGRKGLGKEETPQLMGQHIQYLQAQLPLFIKGMRKHKDTDIIFAKRSPKDIDDLMTYLSILDD